MKIIIIGGVAGGATVAARLRRLSEKDEIIIFERDEHISYANCGLPYFIGDVITDEADLIVQTVKGLSVRYNLDIRIKSEVVFVDINKNIVKVKNLKTGIVYDESFDKLILSCGANPIKPNIEGLNETENVFTLRNIPDTLKIKAYLKNENVKNATIIGGGFIGVEMAENLTCQGAHVTLIEKMPQVLKPFDFEMAQIVHAELNNNNVDLILNDGISSFIDKGKKIILESGKIIETDMTILAIGVTPDNILAKDCKLALGERGHVKTNNHFNVIDKNGEIVENVYAIGDMVEVVNFLDNSNYTMSLAWGANRQAKLVADIINNIKIKESKIQGSSVLKVFGLVCASTGANETILKGKGIKYTAVHAFKTNHAGYYPNATNIALKIIFDEKTGRIFGAQALGKEGTEKRIDIIATTMRLNGSIFDLSDMELCYAPPFSTAKDAVNILGYIAENIASGLYQIVHASEIDEIVKKGGYLIDVRSPYEFSKGHIDGAINLELDSLRDNLNKITVNKTDRIYVNCQVGLRAYLAIRILANNGFTNLVNLSGGYTVYKNYKYKIKQDLNKLTEKEDPNKFGEVVLTGFHC